MTRTRKPAPGQVFIPHTPGQTSILTTSTLRFICDADRRHRYLASQVIIRDGRMWWPATGLADGINRYYEIDLTAIHGGEDW